MDAILAMKCIRPLNVPTRLVGAVSMTTAQNTELGKELKALAKVMSAITATTDCAWDTITKHKVVASKQAAANQLRAMRSLPVRLKSQSENRPPSSTVTHAPVQGIMPIYQSEDRL